MIRTREKIFELHTDKTSYCFRVTTWGHLEHLFYGRKTEFGEDVSALLDKWEFAPGASISYSDKYKNLKLENISHEISTQGKGDLRDEFISIVNSDGSFTSDFIYEGHEIIDKKPLIEGLPSSYDETGNVQTLKIILTDSENSLNLDIYYSVFEKCNVITRRAVLTNHGEQEIILNKLMSLQLDFFDSEYIFTTFNGTWSDEMNKNDNEIKSSKIINESRSGNSSNRANPFVMLSRKETTEDYGDCYGFNLIYSGNHYESVSTCFGGRMRLISGINPWNFSFTIMPGESFSSPEGFMSFSDLGFTDLSHNFHEFIREHIVRGNWKNKPRPVLINSWEASYFKFNQSKLMNMAKAAKEAGIELFVLDDGWFGKRNDDTSSLGDWSPDFKKLPDGLKGLSEKIHKLGMDFGIWVEPEMVNEDSDCFRNHPDWAVKIPGKSHSPGRNQMILDLTKKEVREYVTESMRNVFSSCEINYVKWDMNRNFSDYYSDSLKNQGEFSHRYILGLYEILEKLTGEFPDILFESCASGGNRFDAGMLCYMPQIWASDNTDPVCRVRIQNGYSYGYPMSVLGAHVSGTPNHQTLRKTSIHTRFDVACFGLLGYECNIEELSSEDKEAIKKQVEMYIGIRQQIQFGDFYRIKDGKSDGIYKWMLVSKDKNLAIGVLFQTTLSKSNINLCFKTKGLDEKRIYHFYNNPFKHNIKKFGDLVNMISPIHIKQDSLVHNVAAKFIKMDGEKEDYVSTGSLLNNCGVKLKQGFGGTGFNENVRLMGDFDSRLYFMVGEE